MTIRFSIHLLWCLQHPEVCLDLIFQNFPLHMVLTFEAQTDFDLCLCVEGKNSIVSLLFLVYLYMFYVMVVKLKFQYLCPPHC